MCAWESFRFLSQQLAAHILIMQSRIVIVVRNHIMAANKVNTMPLLQCIVTMNGYRMMFETVDRDFRIAHSAVFYLPWSSSSGLLGSPVPYAFDLGPRCQKERYEARVYRRATIMVNKEYDDCIFYGDGLEGNSCPPGPFICTTQNGSVSTLS